MRTQGGEVIIGRDHPAGVLRAEIARAADSHGGLVLVTGEAGIGKTTLVGGAADEARRRGALVLSGSCWGSDSAPGYWPWVQVVRGLRRAATPGEWAAAEAAGGSGLGVLLGEAPAGPPDGASRPGPDPAEAFRVFDAVTSALVAVAQDRPVVVVLDDLHWADPASLRLLEFAAQHTWFERLLLIGTYRDVEVEPADHPLAPLLLQLVAKATTVTLTGLGRDEVGALIARTAGREPGPELVAEIHRRTGGNPFFVEQTAQLWHADGSVAAVAPGVRDAVGRRLALLPEPVAELLGMAAVLGQEFDPQVLAAAAALAPARLDRLLGRAVGARLVVAAGAGRFAFAHDLVRETLDDALGEPERRRRHAAVVRAVDRDLGLAERLVPAGLARHAYLAGTELEPTRRVELLEAAARDAAARLATEEATGHLRRALEVVDDPARQVKLALKLGQALFFAGGREEAVRLFGEAATLARRLDAPDLLARVALTVDRYQAVDAAAPPADELLREAHRRLVGGEAGPPGHDELVRDLIAATELLARRGGDDKALTFSLWARHDAIWEPGTAREREALTVEMGEVARRSGDHQSEMFAASLRWVALVEQGDPRYLDQVAALVALGGPLAAPRDRMMLAIDRSIIAALQGDFDAAEALLAELDSLGDHGHQDQGWMRQHLGWALSMLRGRVAEASRQLGELERAGHPFAGLLSAITAVEAGDPGPGLRHLAEVDAAGTPYPRAVAWLWRRLLAQTAALTRDPRLCDRARASLAPHRGEWAVSLYGCDISGPVDLWVAVVDAAQERWDDAVAGFTAARDSADRLRARPWSARAGAGLADALARLDAAGDAGTASEFTRDGPVWRLSYGGRVVHLPDAKGLADLHLLLGRPGTDVPAVELLDPAAGPELVAARRLGGDPVLDEQAKESYRRRLTELDEAIDQADGRGDDRRAADLDQERAALLDQLRAAAGLAGRTRRLGDEAERARKTVGARIRHTLRRLDRRHPELAAHLRGAVSTGATCRYAPAEPVAWRL
ncbi:MAG TPA: AAA family ATPase [Actinomycetota bacterium]|nr:AAA family ATPase [Actinomycetota bacterium]